VFIFSPSPNIPTVLTLTALNEDVTLPAPPPNRPLDASDLKTVTIGK